VTPEDLAVIAVRDDLAIVHVVGSAPPAPDLWAAAGPDGPGLHVVLGEGGWLAVAATNTPIAALPTACSARP
jgi:hypothetical protein